MIKKTLLGAGLALATLCAAAQTDYRADPNRALDKAAPDLATQNFWRILDADHDGRLDRQEAKGDHDLVARFKQIDANGDGGLDTKELTASAATPGANPN